MKMSVNLAPGFVLIDTRMLPAEYPHSQMS